MDDRKKTIAITGVGGLIGSYISRELKNNYSFDVISLDRTIIPDLGHFSSIDILKQLGNIDIIIHCAAVVPGGNINNATVAVINRKIDKNIFQYIRETKKKVLFISSMSVYKHYGENVLIDESMPLKKIISSDDYVNEKIRSEYLFNQIDDSVILRISSPYGLGQKNSNVLKIFAEKARKNENIIYFGTGQRTQDFIHANDIANAVLRVVEKNATGIFNITSGESITMRHLAELITELVPGYTGMIKSNDSDDLQESFRANFSNSKAKKLLNWNPVISLSQGLLELL
jgi:UDP-glucose 4-epimerase